jgi:ribosome biogenesis protein MAK21
VNHFHPTVSLYAKTLLSCAPIIPPKTATAYDPLQNHTLARFLDRFVYKNPKKVDTVYKGSSIMQPRPPGTGASGALDEDELAVLDDVMDGRKSRSLIAGGRKRSVFVAEDGGMGRSVAMDDEPVNSKAWLSRGLDKVPVDEVIEF